MSDEHPHNKQYWNRSNLHCKFSILTKEEELWFMDMKNRNKKSVQKTEWVTSLYWVTAPPPALPPTYLSTFVTTFRNILKKISFFKKNYVWTLRLLILSVPETALPQSFGMLEIIPHSIFCRQNSTKTKNYLKERRKVISRWGSFESLSFQSGTNVVSKYETSYFKVEQLFQNGANINVFCCLIIF